MRVFGYTDIGVSQFWGSWIFWRKFGVNLQTWALVALLFLRSKLVLARQLKQAAITIHYVRGPEPGAH
jgi:hypothetical protein